MHRSELKNATYNPRKLDKRAREKLKKNLKDVGLVEAPTWNETTGNIVAGHQRMSQLDDLEQSQDYLLDVHVVRMSEAEERQQNVFMNNPTAQGDYDTTMLADLLKGDGFDKAAAGFDRMDLEVMFVDDELAKMFKTDDATKDMIQDLARVGGTLVPASAFAQPSDAAEQERERQDGEPAPGDEGDDGDGEDRDRDDSDSAADTLDVDEDADTDPAAGPPPQRRSDAVKEFMRSKNDANDTETYAVVVFTTRREREIFMAACGSDPYTRYIDGVRVFSKFGIDPEGEEWAKLFDKPDDAPPASA